MRTLIDARRGIATALLALSVLAGAATVLSACNTTAGFGQDMSAAGTALTNSAVRTKDSL
jgi:entericidin B